MALADQSSAPDRPPGIVYDLDGRRVTNIEGFYCAIGEAINGLGGYLGWNLDALNDCLRGRFGARTPFRLIWHDSALAREHLVAGYDRRPVSPPRARLGLARRSTATSTRRAGVRGGLQRESRQLPLRPRRPRRRLPADEA